MDGGRTALVLGATGLVGGMTVEELLADPTWRRVTTLGRRPTGRAHPRLAERVAPLDALGREADAFAVDDVFCALGTTIAAAGSRAAFRAVDLDAVAEAARLAADGGARRFLLVSALGADAGSRIFYNRVKGEAEEAVRGHGFEAVVLLRPSLLLGPREGRRPGEALAQRVMPWLAPLLAGPLRRYRALPARAVARAMVRLAREAAPGVRTVESDEIARLGGATERT